MRRLLLTTIALVSLGATCAAVETKTWEHNAAQDFEKGTVRKLSLRGDGLLTLAPKLEELLDSSQSVLWAVAEDAQGNLYVGGGGPGSESAKLFRIAAAGGAETVAELEGLEVTAVAVNQGGDVFAATSPDGKVYRIRAGAGSEVFYDPEVKYIWRMAFNSRGDLFLATGDQGEIHRVTPGGAGAVFFRTEETHVRSLAIDAQDNLLVGTDPGGLIMRVTPAGEGFVLYQSGKREVTSVAVAPDGAVYAAAVGAKQPAPPAPPPAPAPAPAAETNPSASPEPAPPAPGGQQVQPAKPASPVPVISIRAQIAGGSEVYRIEPDGYPRMVWSDNREIVYAIAFDSDGRPVLGTGNEGKLIRLDSGRLSTLLLEAPPTQLTALHRGRDGRLIVLTGNIGKVYAVGPATEAEGEYLSEALDAEFFSHWGRIEWRGEPGEGGVALAARSGNLNRPEQNWSGWSETQLDGRGGRIQAPAARFVQYKLTLRASGNGPAPEVKAVRLAYMHKNVAPEIRLIEATPPNYNYPPQPLSLTKRTSITLPPLTTTRRAAAAKTVPASVTQSLQYEKGYTGARWLAVDGNGDELSFKVEIRGERETEWKPLAEDLSDSCFAWDSTAFADGEYRVRVTATDAPSNAPAEALSSSMVSEPFRIDNTPPRIEELAASRTGSGISAGWIAKDDSSVVTKAEYSLNGGDWTLALPTTRLSDSPRLSYELTLEAAPGEHTLAVRVTDEFDNQAVEKVVVR